MGNHPAAIAGQRLNGSTEVAVDLVEHVLSHGYKGIERRSMSAIRVVLTFLYRLAEGSQGRHAVLCIWEPGTSRRKSASGLRSLPERADATSTS